MQTACAMMRLLVVLLGVALGAQDQDEGMRGVAAIKKVIQMMEDMVSKAKKEKAEEEIAFAEFSTWCDGQLKKLDKAIVKEGEEIDGLETSIDKLSEDAKKAGEDFVDLSAEVAEEEADMKSHKGSREKEHATYEEQAADYAESLSAIQRAIQIMSQKDKDIPSAAASLLQVSQTSGMSEKTKDVIAAFVSYAQGTNMTDDMEDEAFDEYAAPGEANAYESSSGGIIGMLKGLLDDFRERKTALDKEEADSKFAYQMVMADLADSVKSNKKDADNKASTKARKLEKESMDKGEKTSTESVKKEDEGSEASIKAECEQKTESFHNKQELRGDEIEAIGKAIEIMSGSDVSSFIESAAVAGRRMMASSSFAQLRKSQLLPEVGRRTEVRKFIVSESKRLQSKSLSLLAETMSADPFAKVKDMIEDMISHLMKEANEDAEHNAFCVGEETKSKATRTTLTEDIDALTAEVDDANARLISLKESNDELTQGISDINEALKEATDMRNKDSKKNAATIEDATAAVKAVDAAMAVLKEFYEKAAEATSLVQESVADSGEPEKKKTFGKAFKGNQETATGVLAMIDVIRSDFATLAEDTKASEEEDLKSYEKLNQESKVNLAVKNKKLEYNEADLVQTTMRLNTASKDLRANQEELEAAQHYWEKLQAQCVAKVTPYEERAAAREKEIQSLKEALKMLASQ